MSLDSTKSPTGLLNHDPTTTTNSTSPAIPMREYELDLTSSSAGPSSTRPNSAPIGTMNGASKSSFTPIDSESFVSNLNGGASFSATSPSFTSMPLKGGPDAVPSY